MFDCLKMSADASLATKSYIDRGVQTEFPALSASADLHPTLLTSLFRESESCAAEGDPESLLLSSPQAALSAYSHSLSPDSSSSSLLTGLRVLKPIQLPYLRPYDFLDERLRVSSLPETAPARSSKAGLYSEVLRVVSMPEQGGSRQHAFDYSMTSNGVNASSCSGEYSLTGTEDQSGIYLPCRQFDIPYTPSPPSSPDSVLIIENNGEISENFLRTKDVEDPIKAREQKDLQQDDDGCLFQRSTLQSLMFFVGWITWARSPPRPIPALHGPLSLPYARCPSYVSLTIS